MAKSRSWIKASLLYGPLLVVPVVALILSQRFNGRPIERVTIGSLGYQDQQRISLARYEWAKQFCRDKTVADIACGTGYGMQILRTVATKVDGYDREPLGQEFVVDLEKQGWTKHYDVIVSFETIEHLRNPEFFLQNAQRTCDTLLLSTPVNEKPGPNPYHKQFWSFAELTSLVGQSFSCEWFSQDEGLIQMGTPLKAAVARCVPVPPRAQTSP